MRLAVNLRLFVKGQIGGIENYVRQVVRGIAQQQQTTLAEWTVFGLESELENIGEFAPGAKLFPVRHETAEETITKELQRCTYDLLFCPLLVLDPLQRLIPSIVTVPDLQHEYLPEYFDKNTLGWRKYTFQPSVLNADTVFTISEYSKSTIVEKFGVDPDKVVVFGLDVDEEFRLPPTPELGHAFQKLAIPENYIYFPANFWRHKNHTNLLRAMRLLVDEGCVDLNLVLTGAPSADMNRVQSEALELGLAERVRFLGYQPKAIVAELYRKAKALAFVSQFEGFGIPILEAFHTGTPVVTSQTTSCPEVAGDAAVFVDERDPADIAAGIRKIIDDEHLRRELVERGKRRTLQYSWSETIASTLQIFESVIRRHRVSQPVEIREYPVVTIVTPSSPLFSVVTPSYNQGRFIRATIESVLSQDYPNVEYIIMDGGSTDETASVVKDYASRLTFISEKDRGQAHAINKGFRMARGNILSWLNSDDLFLPGMIRTVVDGFDEQPNAGAVYGEGYLLDSSGQITGRFPATEPFNLWKLLHLSDYVLQQTVGFRRAVLDEVGYLDEDLHYVMDWDILIRIAKRYPLKYIPTYMGCLREYPEAKSFSGGARRIRELRNMLRVHTGLRFPPGYITYGLDTYQHIWRNRIDRLIAPKFGFLSTALQSAIGSAAEAVIRHVGTESQGLYADGWATRVLRYTLPPGVGSLIITGRLPDLADVREQKLSLYVNSQYVDQYEISPGPFQLTAELRKSLQGELLQVRVVAARWFIPEGDGRRLAYLLDAVRWSEPNV